jgi:hypothetical protein
MLESVEIGSKSSAAILGSGSCPLQLCKAMESIGTPPAAFQMTVLEERLSASIRKFECIGTADAV